MATDYGSDWSTFALNKQGAQDLDTSFQVITGPRVVGEHIARRLLTRRGILDHAPSVGYDIFELLNSHVADYVVSAYIKQECDADERVRTATVSLSRNQDQLSIKISLELVDGATFPLVISISDLLANPKVILG